MRSVMVGLVMLMLVTPTQAGTLVYDFEDESQLADWFEVPTLDGLPYTAEWRVENGELVGFSREPSIISGQGFGIRDDTWRDYTFEVQLKLGQAFLPSNGLPTTFVVVHYHLPPGTLNYHLPPDEIDGKIDSGIWIGIGHSGSWRSVGWSYSVEDRYVPGIFEDMPLEENRWYTVRFETEGNHYRTYIDSKPIFEFDATSPEHAYGIPGFAVRNCEARFDDG